MSSEPKRLLVGKIKRGHAESGKPVIEMWSQDARLKYPELRLFDFSALIDVRIDPNSLAEGEERIARFWAIYEEGSKLNQHKNPYKDVLYLEPIDGQEMTAPAPSLDTDAIIEELRAIRALLEMALFNGQIQTPSEATSPPPPAAEEEPAEEKPGNLGHRQEQPESSDLPPISDEEARREFYKAAGPAIAAGTVDPAVVNELAQVGKHRSWRDALVQLRAKF